MLLILSLWAIVDLDWIPYGRCSKVQVQILWLYYNFRHLYKICRIYDMNAYIVAITGLIFGAACILSHISRSQCAIMTLILELSVMFKPWVFYRYLRLLFRRPVFPRMLINEEVSEKWRNNRDFLHRITLVFSVQQ